MKKNIMKILNNILNNKGKVSSNVTAGLSLGLLAAVIGYGVYSAYNSSPAYNPSVRALYTGEGGNIELSSLKGSGLELDSSSVLPVGADAYSKNDIFAASEYDQTQADKEAAKFNSARAYLEAQKSAQAAAQTAAGANGSSGSIASADGAYQPFNSTYDAGEAPGTFAAKGAAEYGAQQFKEISQQASAAVDAGARGRASQFASGKGTVAAGSKVSVGVNGAGDSNAAGAKGVGDAGRARNSGGTLMASTQVNKLASSNGGSSSSGSGAGSSRGSGSGAVSSGGGSVRSAKDTNTTPLPATRAMGNQAGGDAFTMGRGGAVGGFQVGNSDGGSENVGKGGRGGNAKRDLNVASFYSKQGAATIQSGGEKGLAKGAMEAANAFDGGATITSGPTIDGGSSINTGTHDLGLNIGNDLSGSLNDLKNDFDDYAPSKSALFWSCLKHIFIAFCAAFIAIFAIRAIIDSIGNCGPWGKAFGYIGAALVFAAATYAILGADYDGGKNIWETLNAWDDMRADDGQSKLGWLFKTVMFALVGCVGVSIFWDGIHSAVKGLFGEFTPQVVSAAGSKAGEALIGDVSNKVAESDEE